MTRAIDETERRDHAGAHRDHGSKSNTTLLLRFSCDGCLLCCTAEVVGAGGGRYQIPCRTHAQGHVLSAEVLVKSAGPACCYILEWHRLPEGGAECTNVRLGPTSCVSRAGHPPIPNHAPLPRTSRAKSADGCARRCESVLLSLPGVAVPVAPTATPSIYPTRHMRMQPPTCRPRAQKTAWQY